MKSKMKFTFGGGVFMDVAVLPNGLETIEEILDVLQVEGIQDIDTATLYGQSEVLLGQVQAGSRFTLNTKFPGGFASKPVTAASVVEAGELSLKNLHTDQVDVYYVHAPDRTGSVEELLAGINSLHQAGRFRRFGLSNYLASEVEEVVRICREKGYVRPSVYQGNYSAVARHAEAEIMPTLRRHNIAFYAYSPIAGGFLTRDVEKLAAGDGEGRWNPKSMVGILYHGLYNKPVLLEGLRLWEGIATRSGIPKAELAYRWVAYNSALKGEAGDGIVFGSRNKDQLRQTLHGLMRGPLSPEVAAQVEQMWTVVESEAPLDNYNSLGKGA